MSMSRGTSRGAVGGRVAVGVLMICAVLAVTERPALAQDTFQVSALLPEDAFQPGHTVYDTSVEHGAMTADWTLVRGFPHCRPEAIYSNPNHYAGLYAHSQYDGTGRGFTTFWDNPPREFYGGIAQFGSPFPLEKRQGAWIPRTETNGNEVFTLDTSGVLRFRSSSSSTFVPGWWNWPERWLWDPSPTAQPPLGSYIVETTSSLNLETREARYSLTYTRREIRAVNSGTFCDGGITATYEYTGRYLVLLSPSSPSSSSGVLSTLNPFTVTGAVDSALDVRTIERAAPASKLAADGRAALVVMFKANTKDPVTLTLSNPGAGDWSEGFGLAPFDSEFLTRQLPNAQRTALTLTTPAFPCEPGHRTCTFLALLWAPKKMIPTTPVDPSLGIFPGVLVTVTASQGTLADVTAVVSIVPPPVVLIHGVWSSARGSWRRFKEWLRGRYANDVIVEVDYEKQSHETFRSAITQQKFLDGITSALRRATNIGVAARRVDVVGHSMGGLVARYFLESGRLPMWPSFLTTTPLHTVIFVGTPHMGSPLAVQMALHKLDLPLAEMPLTSSLALRTLDCETCSFAQLFATLGRQVAGGVDSLQFGLGVANLPTEPADFRHIVGIASPSSATERLLNWLIHAYLPVTTTVSSLLEEQPSGHDTIVPRSSQRGGDQGDDPRVEIAGLIHTDLTDGYGVKLGETQNLAVWQQALWWLAEATGSPPAAGGVDGTQAHTASPADASLLEFDGYTEVDPSHLDVSPVTTTVLSLNHAITITATSSTKTLVQVLLFGTPADSTDALFRFATLAPFSMPFTPTRLGTAVFTAIGVFDDQTYAIRELSYPLQAVTAQAPPWKLTLTDAAPVDIGVTTTVRAEASLRIGGTVDVTDVATYAVRGGSSAVFSVAAGGVVTALGNGVDWLDATYEGVSASTLITVGSCAFGVPSLPTNIPGAGGDVVLPITAGPGCAWHASSATPWLSVSPAAGTGNGSVTVTASTNPADRRVGYLEIADQRVPAVQLNPACSYLPLVTVSQQVPAGGEVGSIYVFPEQPNASFCYYPPVAVGASWVSAYPAYGISTGHLYYAVAPNPTLAIRSTTITVGDSVIPVTQQAASVPAIVLEPASQTVVSGEIVTFLAGATGAPAPIAQWQVSTNDGATWGDIGGAYAASYTVTATEAQHGRQYRAVFGNLVGEATTSAATLLVTSADAPGPFGRTLPLNGATGVPTSPTLSWGPSTNATSYEYCLDTTNDDACGTSWVGVGANTSVTVGGLSQTTIYFWHVRAINAEGSTYADGAGAVFRSFTSAGPFSNLLWTADNQMQVWTLNNTSFSGGVGFSGPGPGWTATSYSRGSNNSWQVLWTGDNVAQLWFINPDGTSAGALGLSGPGAGWKATSYFRNPDESWEVLWTNDGLAQVWSINANNTWNSGIGLGGVGAGWTATSYARAADGSHRVLWTNGDNLAQLWTITSGLTWGGMVGLAGPAAGWRASSYRLNPDNSWHVVWTHDNQAQLWSITAANTWGSMLGFGGPVPGWTLESYFK